MNNFENERKNQFEEQDANTSSRNKEQKTESYRELAVEEVEMKAEESILQVEPVAVNVSIEEMEKELNRMERRFSKESRKRFISGTLAGIVLGGALTLGATYQLLPEMLEQRGISFNEAAQNITINPNQDLTVYSAVAKKVMPSVVGITTVSLQRTWLGMQEASGVGTGVIVDARGYILTNSHVVNDGNAKEVKVLLSDGRQLDAKVLWNEASLDLAVIKIEGENFIAADLGDSDGVEVGEIAIAIGNPLGLTFERSLTQGVISGLNRTITINTAGETIENLMQTDASINPGNSGGPLLNAKGQVIGINTAKISTGEGLGFAIPINIAKPIVDQFIENGEFTRVYLGIRGLNLDAYRAYSGEQTPVEHGVYVKEVLENSVAAKYGIQGNDIIVKIDNDEISRMSNLTRSIYKYRPGDKATITVIRNNKEVKVDIVFESFAER